MFDPAEMAERHRRALAEITEQGLMAARELQARLLSAESLEAAAAAGLALQRMHRSVRQSVALEARIARELKRLEREDRDDIQKQAAAAVERRKAQVKATVEQQVRAEYEADDADEVVEDLDTLVAAEALEDGFLDTPIATHVARLRAALGMEPESGEAETETRPSPAPDGLAFDAAPPPDHAPPEPEPDWRSSA